MFSLSRHSQSERNDLFADSSILMQMRTHFNHLNQQKNEIMKTVNIVNCYFHVDIINFDRLLVKNAEYF